MKRHSLIMSDTFGDTWDTVKMTIKTCNGTVAASDISISDNRKIQGQHLCLPESEGYAFTLGNHIWASEVWWSLFDDKNNLLITGGAPYDGAFNCTVVCADNEMRLHLADAAGNGWSGNTLSIRSCGGQSLLEDVTLDSGSQESEDVCVPQEDGYIVVVGGGAWQEDVRWTLNDDSRIVLAGGSPYFGSTSCFSGCHNVTIGTSSISTRSVNLPIMKMTCTISHTGSETFTTQVVGNLLKVTRTDTTSGWSFPLYATCCAPSACHDRDFAVVLTDTVGNGWSGNQLEITDCSGKVLATNITMARGRLDGVEMCIPNSDGYIVKVGGGTRPEEVRWFLLEERRRVLMAGGALASVSLNCPVDVIMTVNPTSAYIPFTPAKYGKALSSLGHEMNLAYAGEGCQTISVPKGAVALVDVSTNCAAYNQTLNAQKASASAVILINKFNSTYAATAPIDVDTS